MKRFVTAEKIILSFLLLALLVLKIETKDPSLGFEIMTDLGIVLIMLGFGEIVTRLALAKISTWVSYLVSPLKNKTTKL